MVTLVTNIGLSSSATNGSTASVGEPTAGSNNQQLMMTGNWYASTSTNGGGAWSYVDPFTLFPATAGGFCCDQSVQYVPKFGIWVWLMQYSPGTNGSNILRVAISRTASFGSWYWWDYSPASANAAWATENFDYPDVAFTNEWLYFAVNSYQGSAWQRAVIFRLPLAALAANTGYSFGIFSTTSNGSLRLTQGAASVMYFASHNSQSQIEVYSWADSSGTVNSQSVNVNGWTQGPYTSQPAAGGINWLGRIDGRMTGAWAGAGQIGFMWTASSDSRHAWDFIRVCVLNESNLSLVSQPDIWSGSAAWSYPAAAPNNSGQVGLSAFYGGGSAHPSHIVGWWTGSAWDTAYAATSTNDPPTAAWGDYVYCAPRNPANGHWVASGFVMQGSAGRTSVQPRYVEFST